MSPFRLIVSILLSGACAGALAAPPQPDPLAPLAAQAATAAPRYDSAFAGYQADPDPKPADWRAANAAVSAPQAATQAADPHAGHQRR